MQQHALLVTCALLSFCGLLASAERIIGADGKPVLRHHRHHHHVRMLNQPVITKSDWNLEYQMLDSTDRSAPKSIALGIARMRGEKCAKLSQREVNDLSEVESFALDKCKGFMTSFCNVGSGGEVDGAERKVASCERFFQSVINTQASSQRQVVEKVVQEKAAVELAAELAAKEKPKSNADASAMADGEPKALPQQTAFHAEPKEKKQKEEQAPESETDEEAPESEAEEKTPQKDNSNDGHLHMDESKKAQEQGFSGKNVAHDDMQTYTGDWRREFGPKSGHRKVSTICKEFPGNPWCQQQVYSLATPLPVFLAYAIAALAMLVRV